MTAIDWIGSLGVLQILLAYILSMTGRVNNTDLGFILLNLIGAGMACIASVLMEYIPFIVLEAAWSLVSFVALMKYLKSKVVK